MRFKLQYPRHPRSRWNRRMAVNFGSATRLRLEGLDCLLRFAPKMPPATPEVEAIPEVN